MQVINVQAVWDPEARVWVAESTDVPGLATEAETLDALIKKLPGMIVDLLEAKSDGQEVEYPFNVIASGPEPVRVHV